MALNPLRQLASVLSKAPEFDLARALWLWRKDLSLAERIAFSLSADFPQSMIWLGAGAPEFGLSAGSALLRQTERCDLAERHDVFGILKHDTFLGSWFSGSFFGARVLIQPSFSMLWFLMAFIALFTFGLCALGSMAAFSYFEHPARLGLALPSFFLSACAFLLVFPLLLSFTLSLASSAAAHSGHGNAGALTLGAYALYGSAPRREKLRARAVDFLSRLTGLSAPSSFIAPETKFSFSWSFFRDALPEALKLARQDPIPTLFEPPTSTFGASQSFSDFHALKISAKPHFQPSAQAENTLEWIRSQLESPQIDSACALPSDPSRPHPKTLRV